MKIALLLFFVFVTFQVYRGIINVLNQANSLDIDNRQGIVVKRVAFLAALWGFCVAIVIYSYMTP